LPNQEPDEPLVSVIVPTFNSSKTIERTIESLENQTWKNVEVIVVDNHSTDDTLEVVARHPLVRVRVFGPERSGQVNYGAGQSQGEFVYRIDSDFVLEPRVIEDAVSACEAGADAVLIHNTSDPTISFWARVRKVERDSLVDDWEHVAARFVRRDVFMALGGFNESLYAEEDRDFHERLVAAGYKVGRIQRTEVHIGEPLTLAEVVRKHVYYGASVRLYIRMRGARAGLRLGPFRGAFLRHWREIGQDPTLLVGFFVYQYVRHLSSLAGLFVSQPARVSGGRATDV
jgi:glycosyltransferase involved in cell wall biosynthesis